MVKKSLATSVDSVNHYAAVDQKVNLISVDSTTSAEHLARYIMAHFSSDEERVRALYSWLGRNVRYDVANLYTFAMSNDVQKTINDVFNRRKAICQGYAEVFTVICKQINIQSYLITGYTKSGRTLATLPHAWNAAWLKGRWYLFDPTWGAGSVDGQAFMKQPNDVFFWCQLTNLYQHICHLTPYSNSWNTLFLIAIL